MDSLPILEGSFQNFEDGVNHLKKQGYDLLNDVDKHKFGTNQKSIEEIGKWYDEIRSLLSKSLKLPTKETEHRYLNLFNNTKLGEYDLRDLKVNNVPQHEKDQIDEINLKINALAYINKAVKISDLVHTEKQKDLFSKRQSSSVKVKKDKVLNKLYQINDGEYFPLKEIFIGNGFYFSEQDVKDFMEFLLNDNYIISESSKEFPCDIRISYHGQEYVEENKLLEDKNTNVWE